MLLALIRPSRSNDLSNRTTFLEGIQFLPATYQSSQDHLGQLQPLRFHPSRLTRVYVLRKLSVPICPESYRGIWLGLTQVHLKYTQSEVPLVQQALARVTTTQILDPADWSSESVFQYGDNPVKIVVLSRLDRFPTNIMLICDQSIPKCNYLKGSDHRVISSYSGLHEEYNVRWTYQCPTLSLPIKYFVVRGKASHVITGRVPQELTSSRLYNNSSPFSNLLTICALFARKGQLDGSRGGLYMPSPFSHWYMFALGWNWIWAYWPSAWLLTLCPSGTWLDSQLKTFVLELLAIIVNIEFTLNNG